VALLTGPSKYERPSPVSVKMVLNIQETKEMYVKEHQGVEYIRNIGRWEKDTTIPKLRLKLFRIAYNTGTGTTTNDDDDNDEDRPTGFRLGISVLILL
jgi:phenolic acid decarboxylase